MRAVSENPLRHHGAAGGPLGTVCVCARMCVVFQILLFCPQEDSLDCRELECSTLTGVPVPAPARRQRLLQRKHPDLPAQAVAFLLPHQFPPTAFGSPAAGGGLGEVVMFLKAQIWLPALLKSVLCSTATLLSRVRIFEKSVRVERSELKLRFHIIQIRQGEKVSLYFCLVRGDLQVAGALDAFQSLAFSLSCGLWDGRQDRSETTTEDKGYTWLYSRT